MEKPTDFIRFRCSRCTHGLKIPASFAGKKVYCPACYQELVVPAESIPDRRTASPDQLYQVDAVPRDTREMVDRYAYAEAVCPLCGTRIAVPDGTKEKTAECPDCGTKFEIDPKKLHHSSDYLAKMRAQTPGSSRQPASAGNISAAGILAHGISAEDVSADIYGIETEGAASPKTPPEKKSIAVHCPVCDSLLYADSTQIGKKIRCPDCETLVAVPHRTAGKTPMPPGSRSYEGGDVYGLSPQGRSMLTEADRIADDSVSQKYETQNGPISGLIPVRCRHCGTLLYAPATEIGRMKVCPDCGVKTRIEGISTEQRAVQTRIEPATTGGYKIAGEMPKEPPQSPPSSLPRPISPPPLPPKSDSFDSFADQIAQTIRHSEPDGPLSRRRPPIPPLQTARRDAVPPPMSAAAPKPALSPEEITLASLAALEKRVQKDAPARSVRRKKKKTDRMRKAVSAEGDDFNGLVPVINDRGDVVLTIPSPPKPVMGFNVFRPLFRFDYWAHWLFFQTMMLPLAGLLYFVILPHLTETESRPANLAGVMIPVISTIALIPLGVLAVWQGSQNIASVFSILSGGGREVREWTEEPVLDGALSGLRYGTIFLSALIPAGICTTLTRLGIVLVPSFVTQLTAVGGLYLLFPVVFLSTIQSGLPILPISGPVLRSFGGCFGAWTGYYIWSGILFAAPAIGVILLPYGGIQGTGMILTAMLTLPAAVPLWARLAWCIEDQERRE